MAAGSFNNPITGVDGALVITQIKSPNFVPNAAGWFIASDGSAEFNNIILPGGQGVSVFFSSTAPVTTHVGDLWYNIANGLLLSQWNGSAWVSYQIGTGAIASGAVTGAQLASSVTARSLGGITTTVSATAPPNANSGDLWINTSNGNVIEQWTGAAWSPILQNAADVLQSGTIVSSLIQAGTITGNLIAAGTIVGNLIAAGTITGSLLEATAIDGFVINGVTINGNQINAADLTITSGAGNAIFVYM